MNILLVSQNIALGGAQRVVINLAYYLEKFGHQVLIFSPHIDLKGVSKIAHKLNYISPNIPILKKVGPSYKMLDNPVKLTVNLCRLRKELKKAVKQYNIDIINAHNPPSQWLASFLSVPVVWSCNEPVSLWPSRKKEYFPLNIEPPGFFGRGIELFYEIVDYIIAQWGITKIVTLSQRTKNEVKALYHRKADICRVGVDFSFFAEGNGNSVRRQYNLEETFVFLQTGHFKHEKNHKCSVEAFSLFKKRLRQKTKLFFVGDGPLRGEIENLVNKLDLNKEVIFTGRVDEESLHDYCHACDCLLFPAFNQSWGLTPFEIMAAGKISIVSDDCGASEVIGSQRIGFVTSPKPKNFAEMMEYVYNHPEKCQERIKRGKKYVQEYLSYEHYSKEMLGIFEHLLQSGKK